MNILNTRDGLLKRIHDKRRNIKSYVENIEPVGIRLTNLNIICGAIATIFTATPALGGETLLGAINEMGLDSITPDIYLPLQPSFPW